MTVSAVLKLHLSPGLERQFWHTLFSGHPGQYRAWTAAGPLLGENHLLHSSGNRRRSYSAASVQPFTANPLASRTPRPSTSITSFFVRLLPPDTQFNNDEYPSSQGDTVMAWKPQGTEVIDLTSSPSPSPSPPPAYPPAHRPIRIDLRSESRSSELPTRPPVNNFTQRVGLPSLPPFPTTTREHVSKPPTTVDKTVLDPQESDDVINVDDEDDKEVKEAIALSLAETQSRPNDGNTRTQGQDDVISVNDENDEELERAIAMSLSDHASVVGGGAVATHQRSNDRTVNEEDDHELKEAIAMSLTMSQKERDPGNDGAVDKNLSQKESKCKTGGNAREPRHHNNNIVTEDARVTQLDLPSEPNDGVQKNQDTVEGDSVQMEVATQPLSGFASLDRKAMEAQRLERKRKREAVTTEVNGGPFPTIISVVMPAKSIEQDSKRIKTSEPVTRSMSRTISPPPAKSRTAPPCRIDFGPTAAAMKPSSGVIPRFYEPKSNYYPLPTLLRTHTPFDNHPEDPSQLPTTNLSSLLNCPVSNSTANLSSALLSSFTIDFDFLLPHFKTKSTNFVFILHATSGAHRTALESDFSGIPNVRLVFPQAQGGMKGFGTMHSKLMILFYGPETVSSGLTVNETKWQHGRCRIIIPTGNLVAYDWGQNGSLATNAPTEAKDNAKANIENLVWVADLPLLAPASAEPVETAFQTDLHAYLATQGVPTNVDKKLRTFDFTATQDVGFVGSTAGFHFPASNPTALQSLSSQVKRMDLLPPPNSPPPQVDYLTSSLGNLNPPWVQNFYSTLTGRPSIAASNINLVPNFRIHFPSSTTVSTSLPGPQAAGTICFAEKWWNAPNFPRNLLVDGTTRSCEGRGLAHGKMIAVRFGQRKQTKSGKTLLGYYYVGSANCSGSAWGQESNDRKSGGKKVTVRNWEVGVLMPVYAPEGVGAEGDGEVTVEDPANAGVPLTMVVPGKGILESGKVPWSGGGGGFSGRD